MVLAVYDDAYEWVELPNTLGMALYADGVIHVYQAVHIQWELHKQNV